MSRLDPPPCESASRGSVALLVTGLSHGGAETQLYRLAVDLRTRGWEVSVISLLPGGPYADALEARGIPVFDAGARRGRLRPGAVVRLYRVLTRLQPQVLVTFMYHANVLGRIAGRLAGVPSIVGSIRNEHFGGPWRERMERWTERLSDYTTTNSQLAARSLVERRVVRAGRLRVIPNAIETRRAGEATRAAGALLRTEMGVPESAFLWVAVGHLEEQKDYPTLFEAFQALLEQGEAHRLWVAGEGSRHDALTELLRGKGLDGHVKLLGMRRDVPALLQAADGYVMSSAWEGMPNTVMEALVAARPVVSTRVGGVGELVQDGETGFLVPRRDPVALAESMRRLSRMPLEERRSMGEMGRRHVELHFDTDRVMTVWDGFLSSLLPAVGARGRSSE